jgi:hypothetical protein
VPGVAWTWAKSDASDAVALANLTVFQLDGRGLPAPTGSVVACSLRNSVGLRGDRCTGAELAADLRNGEWVVAFHRDRDLARIGDETVLVVTGVTPSTVGSPAFVRDTLFETSPGDGHRAPTVEIDENRIVLTTLGEANGKRGATLYWYTGFTRPSSGDVLQFVSDVRRGCRTPADLALRDRDLYMTSDCEVDDGVFRVHGFYAHTRIQQFPIVEVVEDPRASRAIPDAEPAQPRVAFREDESTDGPVPVFGWTADVDLRPGDGVPDEALLIDP